MSILSLNFSVSCYFSSITFILRSVHQLGFLPLNFLLSSFHYIKDIEPRAPNRSGQVRSAG